MAWDFETAEVDSKWFVTIADGPTEVQKITLAKQVPRDYQASDDLFPSAHGLKCATAARALYENE